VMEVMRIFMKFWPFSSAVSLLFLSFTRNSIRRTVKRSRPAAEPSFAMYPADISTWSKETDAGPGGVGLNRPIHTGKDVKLQLQRSQLVVVAKREHGPPMRRVRADGRDEARPNTVKNL